MGDCVITVRSQTAAERARRAAALERVNAVIVSIDPSVTKRGCALGLRLPCEDVEQMKAVLNKKNIPYGDVIGRGV